MWTPTPATGLAALRTHYSRRLADAIAGMLGQLGKTNISDGLLAAEDMLTGPSARSGVAKVVMILTDGQQSNEYGGDGAAVQQAQSLKAQVNDVGLAHSCRLPDGT